MAAATTRMATRVLASGPWEHEAKEVSSSAHLVDHVRDDRDEHRPRHGIAIRDCEGVVRAEDRRRDL